MEKTKYSMHMALSSYGRFFFDLKHKRLFINGKPIDRREAFLMGYTADQIINNETPIEIKNIEK